MNENPEHPDLHIEEAFPAMYAQLREMAHRQLNRERADHTLHTTALVHEAYLKMAVQEKKQFENQDHFFALASLAMRRILVSYARKKKSQKRGGDRIRMTLGSQELVMDTKADDILAIHEALERFAELNQRQARIIEHWFFGGFSHEEIAKILEVSVPTVRRDWRLARAWLSRELKQDFSHYDS